jgi:hypothetical protein
MKYTLVTALLALAIVTGAAAAEANPNVLFVGDSLMKEVGRSGRRQLARVGGAAEVESSIGSGLARFDLYDWSAKLREKLGAKPSAVVVLLGANDEQDMDSPSGPVSYGTPAWSEAYGQRVDLLLAIAKASGTKLWWIGLPRMKGAQSDVHANLVNGILRARIAASQADGVVFVDIADIYAVEGKYSSFILIPPNSQVLEVRAEDGIHFNRSGADHLATLILGKIL